jgi:hypothetical protein
VNPFDRFFHGEHGASRSYLLSKGFLFLLALDTWMLMIGHAGRYGVAGFNVAHFAWLDALVLLLTGLLSLVVMLTGIRKSTGLALFALYTMSWAMSMLDSYQHHYLVSLCLLCLAFFPSAGADELHPLPKPAAPEGSRKAGRQEEERRRVEGQELGGFVYLAAVLASALAWWIVDRSGHTWAAFFLLAGGIGVATFVYRPERREPLLRSGFGYPLLGATISIVYTYTAIAKMDPNWLEGHTILRITAIEKSFAGLAELGASLGIERQRFWALFATFVIPQELYMAVAYLVAPQQDRVRGSWVRAMCGLAFLLALALHVGAEAMGLEIGWFSYYMLLFGVCFLLPLPVVDRLATVATWPARLLHRQAAQWERAAPPSVLSTVLSSLGGVIALALAGVMIDLPGAVEACALAGGVLVLVAVGGFVRAQVDTRRLVLATMVAALMMWGAIALSPVRWDFYRYLGGDLARRDESKAALEAYRRGERYAPPGQTRADKIADLEKQLGED